MLRATHLTLYLLLTFCGVFTAPAQDVRKDGMASTQIVTATATTDCLRFVAPGAVVQLRLEVYTESGQKIFDTEMRGGNVLDWHLQDGAGERLAPGSYACVMTLKSLSGRLSQRLGLVAVQESQTSVMALETAQLSLAQQQAIGPLEGTAGFTVLQDNKNAITALTHDGMNGQVSRSRGALSFAVGDIFSGKEVEQMRLTEDGNLGIGTKEPQAKLDVLGDIHSTGAIKAGRVEFPDGTVQSTGQSGRVDKDGNVIPNAAGTGTQNFVAKWTETGGSGTLGNSGLFEAANGNIGIGTTTPAHPFVVRRNGGTLGVHSIGELFVDRDDRTRSASLTVGTAGVLKWIFGMPFDSDGFQVFDLTNNVSRFFIDPTSGNIGVGTNIPAGGHKLDVAGTINATQYNIGGFRTFSSPLNENLFVGQFAGQTNTTGESNAFVGERAGNLNTTGGANSFFGTAAGLLNTTGDHNTMIGALAGGTLGSLSYATAIGADAKVSTSNTIALGRSTGADNVLAYGGMQIGANPDALFMIKPTDSSPNAGFIRFGDNTGWKLHIGRSRETSGGPLNTGTTGIVMTIQDDGRMQIGNLSAQQFLISVGSYNDGTRNRSAVFNGDVTVLGSLSKGGGSFKIDHPLDPANKYLYHSFVESPDMMNIYNGNVMLDDHGEAIVLLPEWFSALNRDFRYQLTCLGSFAPIYIADEINGNRFKIAGGRAGTKVSWQVTGIRQDAYANKNRILVEEDKPERERGRYLHPEAFGQPPDKSIMRSPSQP